MELRKCSEREKFRACECAVVLFQNATRETLACLLQVSLPFLTSREDWENTSPTPDFVGSLEGVARVTCTQIDPCLQMQTERKRRQKMQSEVCETKASYVDRHAFVWRGAHTYTGDNRMSGIDKNRVSPRLRGNRNVSLTKTVSVHFSPSVESTLRASSSASTNENSTLPPPPSLRLPLRRRRHASKDIPTEHTSSTHACTSVHIPAPTYGRILYIQIQSIHIHRYMYMYRHTPTREHHTQYADAW